MMNTFKRNQNTKNTYQRCYVKHNVDRLNWIALDSLDLHEKLNQEEK